MGDAAHGADRIGCDPFDTIGWDEARWVFFLCGGAASGRRPGSPPTPGPACAGLSQEVAYSIVIH